VAAEIMLGLPYEAYEVQPVIQGAYVPSASPIHSERAGGWFDTGRGDRDSWFGR